MDVSKLQNILWDLTSDYENDISEILDTLISNIRMSNSAEIKNNSIKLEKIFVNSISNKYNPSNNKIMEKIKATDYFGENGYKKIEDLLNKDSYDIARTLLDLGTFIQKRTEFITLIQTTSDNLQKLNILPHSFEGDTFEVGLLMPKELTQNKIVNITKELNNWDKVFKTLKEVTTGSFDDTEINFVNNGSLEFFINNGHEIACCLAIILERTIKLYKNIIEIRIAKAKLKELGITTGEQKTIEKQEKDIVTNELDSIASDIIKEFTNKQIEQGRVNELKIAVKGHVTYIAKCIDNGMIIEINPPEIYEPDEVKETDTQEKKEEAKKLKESYNKTLTQIAIIQKSMDAVKTIDKTGVDIIKYLTEG